MPEHVVVAFDIGLFARKLAARREAQGFGPSELSTATGIAATRLGELERGSVEPTGDEVLILADALRVDFRFFVSSDLTAPDDQIDVLFRRYGDRVHREDRRAITDLLYLCETEHLLQRALERRHRVEPFAFAKRGTFFKGQGIEAARALRQHLGLDANTAIDDIFATARALGVHVFRRRLPNREISGLTIRHRSAGPCIVVNVDEDPYRQRFTLAHELGHVFLDADEDVVVSFLKEKGDEEMRANAFAGELLVPVDAVRALHGQSIDEELFRRLANRMQVNAMTLAIKLKDASVLDERTFRTLSALRMPRQGKADPELGDTLTTTQRKRKVALLEQGLSQHYVDLCLDAYDQGEISAGRLGEALLITEAELGEITALYGRGVRAHA